MNTDDLNETQQPSTEERLQDSLPNEVWIKYLIADLRKTKKRLEDSLRYAKGLEEENVILQKKVELYESWMEDIPDKMNFLPQIAKKVEALQNYIKKNFPKRIVQLKTLKKTIIYQRKYISQLEIVLTNNGIECPPRKPNPTAIEAEIENVDDYAIRGKHETFDSNPLDVSVSAYI